MTYLCRRLRPCSTDTWKEVEESSPERAANEYHVNTPLSESYVVVEYSEDRSSRQEVCFALIEVKGYGTFISRYYYSRIYRMGGIRIPTSTNRLKEIAEALEFDGPYEELLSHGWDEEEEEWR